MEGSSGSSCSTGTWLPECFFDFVSDVGAGREGEPDVVFVGIRVRSEFASADGFGVSACSLGLKSSGDPGTLDVGEVTASTETIRHEAFA